MTSLFAKSHNMVVILEKSDAVGGFEQIIDFLSRSYIYHDLTMNPHVYISCIKQFWNTAVVKRSGDVTRLQALVDKKRIVITEEVVCEIQQLNDAEGVICMPNDDIFAGLAQMGYEKSSTKLTFYKTFFSTQWKFFIHTILLFLSAKQISWNEFSSAMASALICLSLDDVVQEHVLEEISTEVVPPTSTSPSSPVILSSPPHQSPSPPQPQAAEGSSHLVQQVLDKFSALVLRVGGLENANVAQQLEIIKLKARVKKLERLNKVKSSKLKRLMKVGTSQRVESSGDVENVFNQGRMSVDIETDEGVELDDTEVQEAIEVVTTAKLITEVVTAVATQVAAASTPIPAAKRKILKITIALTASTRRRKGVVIRDPEEELHTDTLVETPTVKDKGYKMEFFKGKTYDQILPIFQARFDANMKFLFKTREEMEKEDKEIIKSINETPAQKVTKRRKLNEQDPIWRNQKSVHGLALVKRWKLLNSCGVHVIILSTVQLFLLVER
nr:hypothetical protein [Tanacetum cinerariifolium]